MKTNSLIKNEADLFFQSVSTNDFYSFTRCDFKSGVLIDLSYRKALFDAEKAEDFIKRMQSIKEETLLSEYDELIIEVIEDFCNYIVTNEKYYWYKFNITHNTCPIPYLIKGLSKFPINNDSDLENYVRLLEQMPSTMKFIREKLHLQRGKGITIPPEECVITEKMLKGFIQDPDNGDLSYVSKADNHILKDREYFEHRINNAIARFNDEIKITIEYLKNDYIKNVESKPGLCNQPGGTEYYKALVKVFTSYELTPEEVHNIGLKNLEITKSKMQDIIKRLGFDLGIEEFNKLLNKDSRFFDKTKEDLGNRLTKHLELIRPLLKDYFYNQPLADCEVRPIEAARESSTSWGYYAVPVGTDKNGVYYFSGGELNTRCQIRAAAIVYHELLPGHHFQMNLIAEDESLPKICNNHFNTAFADGWAEYSADLANEMGLYTDYDLYGRYLWDLVLCTRLVVDTGLNALGWTMDKARDFMKQNTSLTGEEIFIESLRYAVDMPGQALAYKMGSLKMQELRRKAETTLQEKFDIKDYHEAVLQLGSIPLNILEKKINKFIA
ncbi:MAG: DUF885 domain-containing protein [Clostridia bacterium]